MVLGIGTFISNMMVQGFQSPVFGTPQDMELEYEDVEFKTSDGVTLRGWLIKGGNGNNEKVIVQSHFGVQCCRSGYTPDGKGMMAPFPRKIEFLKAVPAYVDAGYSVLMYDMRNHGSSDKGTCEYVSWGPNESNDVIAAVDFVANQRSYSKIALLSVCMGGASTTYAYGLGKENGLSKYDDKIKSLAIIQPLLYSQMIHNMGMPSMLESQSTSVTKDRLGFSLEEKTFMPDVSKITVPTLVVQNNNDPFHKHEEVQAYYDELKVEKDITWLDLEKQRFSNYEWLTKPEGTARILEWFNKYIDN